MAGGLAGLLVLVLVLVLGGGGVLRDELANLDLRVEWRVDLDLRVEWMGGSASQLASSLAVSLSLSLRFCFCFRNLKNFEFETQN